MIHTIANLTKKSIMLLLNLVLFLPFLAFADGAFIPPLDYYVYAPQQKAVIVYEKEKNRETLILSTEFRGNAADFGWIIPVPEKPEVSVSSNELFTSLEKLTTPKTVSYETTRTRGIESAPRSAIPESVKVVETKEVGIYETKVLEATDSQALATWLSENKYMYPKEGSYILDEYIKKNWYFVAAKINAQAVPTLQTTKDLYEGHAQPLKLVFNTNKIIYPLKISSLQTTLATISKQKEESNTQNPPESQNLKTKKMFIPSPKPTYKPIYTLPSTVKILIYLFADKKMDTPKLNIEYAGYLSPKTIEKLAYPEGEPWWKPNKKFYLTKFFGSIPFSAMNEDIIFREASNNQPIGGGEGSDFSKALNIAFGFVIAFLVWVFSLVGLVFIIFTFVCRTTKSKVVYNVGRVFQWLSFGVTLFAYIVYLLYLADKGFYERIGEFYSTDLKLLGGIIFGFVAFFVMLIILLIQEAKYKKISSQFK